MASKPRKPVAKKIRTATPKGADATSERSKDTKKSFGKAAPRRATNAAAPSKAARTLAGDDKSVIAGIVESIKGAASNLFGRNPKQAKSKNK